MKKTLSLLAVVTLILTMLVPMMAVSAATVYSAANGYIAATTDWTYSGLTYDATNGFGDKSAGSYVEFQVDFGSTGYNTIKVSGAEMHATWNWEVFIDGASQGNAKGNANGQGWHASVADIGTVLLSKTYTGVHTVKLVCVDGGNIHGVEFVNTAIPCYDAANGKITASADWINSGNGMDGDTFGWIGADTYFAFDVNFGSTGYNTLTVYAAEPNESWNYDVYIDGVLVGQANGSANGAGWSGANATAGTVLLPATYTGIHRVKLTAAPNNGGAYKGNMYAVEMSNTGLPCYSAASQIAASDSWKYTGCNWEANNGGFGSITSSTSFLFDVDFGSTGYNKMTIGAADMSESWKYQVSIDGQVVGVTGGAPGGGWALSNVTEGSLFLPGTVTGKHTVKITALANNAGNYKGNMYYVSFANVAAFGAMAWGYLPVSEQQYWVSDATLETPNAGENLTNCYGSFGDYEKRASALMDFGSAAVDCLYFYLAQPAVAPNAKVYIDGAYVGDATAANVTASYTSGVEVAFDLPFALNGVHSVTVSTNSSNLFYIRPHTHTYTAGNCTVGLSCPWCGKVAESIPGAHSFANGACTVCGVPELGYQGTSINEAANALRFGFSLTANNITVNNYTRDITNATITVGGNTYTLVDFGAIVSNNASATLTLEGVDGSRTKNIVADKLYSVEGSTAYFACGIKNIPANYTSATIYARAYYIYNDGTQDIVVYGDVHSQSIDNYLAS